MYQFEDYIKYEIEIGSILKLRLLKLAFQKIQRDFE